MRSKILETRGVMRCRWRSWGKKKHNYTQIVKWICLWQCDFREGDFVIWHDINWHDLEALLRGCWSDKKPVCSLQMNDDVTTGCSRAGGVSSAVWQQTDLAATPFWDIWTDRKFKKKNVFFRSFINGQRPEEKLSALSFRQVSLCHLAVLKTTAVNVCVLNFSSLYTASFR